MTTSATRRFTKPLYQDLRTMEIPGSRRRSFGGMSKSHSIVRNWLTVIAGAFLEVNAAECNLKKRMMKPGSNSFVGRLDPRQHLERWKSGPGYWMREVHLKGTRIPATATPRPRHPMRSLKMLAVSLLLRSTQDFSTPRTWTGRQ